MPKSSAFSNDLLAHVLTGTDSPLDGVSIYVSLHSADPGDGDQSTEEVEYAGYERAAIDRSSDSWLVVDGRYSNAEMIQFPKATLATTDTVSHVGLGTDDSGPGYLSYVIALARPLQITTRKKLIIPIGRLSFLES